MTNRGAAQWPLISLALSGVAVLIYVAAPETTTRFDLLVLDHSEPRWWPWLTAHFLHTDGAHLGWNLVAFLCMGSLGEPGHRVRYTLSILLGIAAVDSWFAWSAHGLRYYCGLSGVLNTVLLATLYGQRDTIAPRWLIVFALLVALKIAWEWHSGIALLTHTQWPPAAGAHIAGYAAGVVFVALCAWRDRVAP